jgi:hypothetical protein
MMKTNIASLTVLIALFSLSLPASAIVGDIDGNSTVNLDDIAILATNWLADDCVAQTWCDQADIDQYGNVDFVDFAMLAEHWTETEPYIVTLLTSFEPSEPWFLTTTSPDSVTPTPIPASSVGLTATHGDYILELDYVNEADGKIEVYLHWSGASFDMTGQTQILADVYFATDCLPMSVIGIWDNVLGWTGNWAPAFTTGQWHTVEFDLTPSTATINQISAYIFEGLSASSGTIYMDYLRLRRPNPAYVIPAPSGVVVSGHEKRIDVVWQPVDVPGFLGYNIYRSASAAGPFTKQNSSPYQLTVYSDFLNVNDQTYHYYVTSVGGSESAASVINSATSYAMTDDQLLESVEHATFRYFWDYGHPVSGLARDGIDNSDRCAVGGAGMGMMAICVGAERGFVTRAQAAQRMLKIMTFLNEKADRFHGVWPHFVDGVTGAAHDNGGYDDAADLVETAYVAQGLLTVRQYFDNTGDPTETAVRNLATQLWEDIDWYWHLRRTEPGYEDNETLFWHWSPNHGWLMDHYVRGFDECMITYLLAIASPTHPIPASCYYNGWTGNANYANGRILYGHPIPVGNYYLGFGGPMFFMHYTFLGFDPDWSDIYCNYLENNRSISLADRAYCAANPGGYDDYSDLVWGLTASYNPYTGYKAHCPFDVDDGTISPTAALSSIVYTPTESIATLKHFYHTYGPTGLWGPFGFYDAFNPGYPDWYADSYIAIDQGPIVVMIENYRSGLCWDLFMANPEITSMIAAIAATEATPITFDDFDGNNINNGWAAGTWPLDPANTEQVHGGNYALKVQYDKNGEAWAYIGAVPTAGSRDFSGHRILKFWIYSSKATTYLFKVESPAFEKQFYVVADHWQEVTMKFGDAAPGLTNVSLVLIFPEPAETTGTGTFWLDDIQLK